MDILWNIELFKIGKIIIEDVIERWTPIEGGVEAQIIFNEIPSNYIIEAILNSLCKPLDKIIGNLPILLIVPEEDIFKIEIEGEVFLIYPPTLKDKNGSYIIAPHGIKIINNKFIYVRQPSTEVYSWLKTCTPPIILSSIVRKIK